MKRAELNGAGRRRFLPRLLVAAFAAIVTLSLVEVALRLFARQDVERLLATRRHRVAADATTVLCVGDSYTFGLYYRPEEAWPARLEQILNSPGPERANGGEDGERSNGQEPFEGRFLVENGGVPAQNLAQIAARLPDQIERLKPKVLVVLGGFNDRWNFAAPEEQGAIAEFFADLRLVRLVRLAFASGSAGDGDEVELDAATRIERFTQTEIAVENADGQVAIDVQTGEKRLGGDEHAGPVARRLEQIAAIARAANVLVMLASYPSPEPVYEPPSRAAADVARRLDLPFIDLRASFARQLEHTAYHELFIPGDRHPTDRGHWRMAWLVAREFAKRGLFVPPPGVREALASEPESGFSLPGMREQVWPVTIARAPDRTWMLGGPPNAHYRIALSGATSPSQTFGRLVVPLADDAVFQRSIADGRLEGVFDGEGRATFVLPADAAKGARFVLLAVQHDMLLNATDLLVRGTAGPIEIE